MLDAFRLSSEIDAYCSPSRIKSRNNQTTAARSFFKRLIGETHAPRRLPGPGLVCPAAAVTTASTAYYSAAAAAAAAADAAATPATNNSATTAQRVPSIFFCLKTQHKYQTAFVNVRSYVLIIEKKYFKEVSCAFDDL